MVSQKVIVKNKLGIHLRPATLLSKNALEFDSKISLRIKEIEVNLKSVLGVLGAGVSQDEEIEIICDGHDEEKALRTIIELVESGMGDSLD